MKNFELRIARELLGLSQSEAAKEIGNVSVRSWNYWESGENNIPKDVQNTILRLLEKRRKVIRFVLQQGKEAKKIAVIYYNTPDYCNSILEWRFSQSLARTLALDLGATLVEFEPLSYFDWLDGNKMQDNQQSRSEWAAYQSQTKK